MLTDMVKQLSGQKRLNNILGSYGNFGVDSNADGLADGWFAYGVASKSLTDNIQTFTANTQYGRLEIPSITCKLNDVFYFCMWVKASYTQVYAQIGDNPQYPTTLYTNVGNWQFVSCRYVKIVDDTSVTFYIADSRPSGWLPAYIKQATILNLTKDLGTGNEPTKEQMDSWIQARPYFDKRDYIT